jgi:hypothetical protein
MSPFALSTSPTYVRITCKSPATRALPSHPRQASKRASELSPSNGRGEVRVDGRGQAIVMVLGLCCVVRGAAAVAARQVTGSNIARIRRHIQFTTRDSERGGHAGCLLRPCRSTVMPNEQRNPYMLAPICTSTQTLYRKPQTTMTIHEYAWLVPQCICTAHCRCTI